MDDLKVTVHFIDGPTGREIYTGMITIPSMLSELESWGGFRANVNKVVYNLAQYIGEKVR